MLIVKEAFLFIVQEAFLFIVRRRFSVVLAKCKGASVVCFTTPYDIPAEEHAI